MPAHKRRAVAGDDEGAPTAAVAVKEPEEVEAAAAAAAAAAAQKEDRPRKKPAAARKNRKKKASKVDESLLSPQERARRETQREKQRAARERQAAAAAAAGGETAATAPARSTKKSRAPRPASPSAAAAAAAAAVSDAAADDVDDEKKMRTATAKKTQAKKEKKGSKKGSKSKAGASAASEKESSGDDDDDAAEGSLTAAERALRRSVAPVHVPDPRRKGDAAPTGEPCAAGTLATRRAQWRFLAEAHNAHNPAQAWIIPEDDDDEEEDEDAASQQFAALTGGRAVHASQLRLATEHAVEARVDLSALRGTVDTLLGSKKWCGPRADKSFAKRAAKKARKQKKKQQQQQEKGGSGAASSSSSSAAAAAAAVAAAGEAAESAAMEGAPFVLVVCMSALRCTDVVRALKREADGSASAAAALPTVRAAKLFAKHMKIGEQQEQLAQQRIDVAVGTPSRLLALLENGALRTSRLKLIVFDVVYTTPKNQNLLTAPETRREVFDIALHDAVAGADAPAAAPLPILLW